MLWPDDGFLCASSILKLSFSLRKDAVATDVLFPSTMPALKSRL